MVNYSFSLLTFEYFLLVLVRITSFVFSAPFFSMSNTPGRVKIGFSVFVSILLIGVLPESTIEYGGVIEYATIVVKEGITGLLIGFGANICNSIVLFAGNIMDLNMGLSMATEYDPVSKTNSPITGNFYNYLVMLLLMSSGMYQYILQAIVDSFTLIPVNGQNFMWDSLLQTMVSYDGFHGAWFPGGTSCFCSVNDIELYSWNHGKDCTTDEYVFCWYPA